MRVELGIRRIPRFSELTEIRILFDLECLLDELCSFRRLWHFITQGYLLEEHVDMLREAYVDALLLRCHMHTSVSKVYHLCNSVFWCKFVHLR